MKLQAAERNRISAPASRGGAVVLHGVGPSDGAKGPTPCKTYRLYLIIDFTFSGSFGRCSSSCATLVSQTPSCETKRTGQRWVRASTAQKAQGESREPIKLAPSPSPEAKS